MGMEEGSLRPNAIMKQMDDKMEGIIGETALSGVEYGIDVITNNEMDGKNAKVESFRVSIETKSNTFKENAVLVFFGVVLSTGAMAVFVGAHCIRRRNLGVPIVRGRTEHHTCKSVFYAEISDVYNIHGSKGEEIGMETLEVELDGKRDNNTTQLVCCSGEAGSDDEDSNVYNVLQPNYGTERTVPVVDPKNK